MDEKIAVSVQGVYKNFILPHERVNSIKSLFTTMAKKRNKTNETQHALKNISFEIKKGEFFGIVGRNGSGKSTLLKILADIYQPTQGKIATVGKLVPFIELGVGFNPELTGRENVYLNGAMLGFSQKEVESMYNDIVAFAELERFMDQKLKNYSSGMQVRLAFSMATRAEADILLVDEVLAVGDADFQRKCFEYFRDLKRNNKTVIFVSHDMSSVREYCDRVALIDKSELQFIGSADTAAKKYTQLFVPKEVSIEAEKKQKWGSGGIEITSVKTDKKVYQDSDKEINITVTFKASDDFINGVAHGITIKNESGQPLCGTNNKIIRVESPRIKVGEVVTASWNVPNIFNEGKLIIEPAVANATNMDICQWWDDALTIRIINERKTPYLVAPHMSLNFEV